MTNEGQESDPQLLLPVCQVNHRLNQEVGDLERSLCQKCTAEERTMCHNIGKALRI